MQDNDNKIHIANENLPSGFELEDILAEYQAALPEVAPENESLADRSKRIVMEAIDQTVGEASFSSLDDIIDDAAGQVAEDEKESAAAAEPEPEPEPEAEAEPYADDALSEHQQSVIDELTREYKSKRTLDFLEKRAAEFQASQLDDTDARAQYATPKFEFDDMAAEDAGGDEKPPRGEKAASEKNMTERLFAPIIAIMALVAMRRGQRRRGDEQKPTEDREDADAPEMEPEKAAKLYSSQLRSLKFRGKIAIGVSLVMIYLSYAYYSSLPLLGALNGNVRVMSLLLMLFELTMMLVGLDVFTSGMMSLSRRRPGLDSLVAASCVLSVIDAIAMAIMKNSILGLPFCAVSAVSMTFSIWGAYFTCKGYRATFRVLGSSKKLYAVTGETGIAGSGVALLKSRRGVHGFVNRSEEADLTEYAYGVAAPILLAASLVFGALASLAHGQPNAFFHCVSIMVAASATFSAGISFALPFAITARRLFQSGAAVAGWSGVRDIGKSRHIVITDSDVFPQGTVEISGIRILEGAFTDKVISYTGSVIAASGNGLSGAFAELIKRNGYSINRIEHFEPHDGGGMTAMVNGENVYVGNAGFMNLMGIRVPQKLSSKYSVFTAINGSLVGIFNISYKPVSSVQDALVLLLHSNREPVFAIRDFNITPMMIKQKFRMPTDSFEFPPYSERFRISGAQPDEDSGIAAVISREGMGPLVDAADRGKRLYNGVRTGTVISVIGSALGVILMFLLCWARAFGSATVANVLTFMFIWLVPSVIICWGIQK